MSYQEDFQQWLYTQLASNVLRGPAASEAVAAGLLCDCLSLTRASGSHASFFPTDVLETIGEELVFHGESLWLVGRRQLEWVSPDNFSMQGDKYFVNGRQSRRPVLHVRYRTDRRTMRGKSPLASSPVFQQLSRALDKRMEEESRIQARHVLPTPMTAGVKKGDSKEAQQNILKIIHDNFRKMVGDIFPVTSFRRVNDQYDPKEYQPIPWGPKYMQANLMAADTVRRVALGALGVPQELIEGGGSGLRESMRHYIHTTLPPYGKRIETAAERVNLEVNLDFTQVLMGDLIAIGRVFNSLVGQQPGDKLDRDEALGLIGVELAE